MRKSFSLLFMISGLILSSVLVLAVGGQRNEVAASGIENRPQANILFNGDLELGTREPWLYEIGDIFGVALRSAPAHGTYSLEIVADEGDQTVLVGGGGHTCSGIQGGNFWPVAISTNTSYLLKGDSYRPGVPSGDPQTGIDIVWYSACDPQTAVANNSLPRIHGPYDTWTPLEGIVTSPANAHYALVGLYLRSGTQEVYGAFFDDISLEPYTGSSPTPTTPATSTPVQPTATPTASPTATSIPPRCPGERFTDVCPGDYFYTPTLNLNDRGVIAGYNSSPPCGTLADVPCFKPYNNLSRGQATKILTLAAGFEPSPIGQQFADVAEHSTFYTYTYELVDRGIIAGYQCGGEGEPCIPPSNLPYFRPNSNVTRGQLSKMVALTFEYSDPVSGQAFEDVPVGSTFYNYIMQLAARGFLNGYPCGGSGEPCGNANLPYFRTANPVTRGQTAKIVYLAAPGGRKW